MKSLEIKISKAITGGIRELEKLQIRSGEPQGTFWPTCAVVMSVFLMDLKDGDALPMPWDELVKLGEDIKEKCRQVVDSQAKKN